MKTYKNMTIKTKKITAISCDNCNKKIDLKNCEEFHDLSFTGGYASNFGDMTKVSCDLCDKCMFELIGDICHYD